MFNRYRSSSKSLNKLVFSASKLLCVRIDTTSNKYVTTSLTRVYTSARINIGLELVGSRGTVSQLVKSLWRKSLAARTVQI